MRTFTAAALLAIGALLASCSYQPLLGGGSPVDGVVATETRDAIVYRPAGAEPAVGLVFYPGGLVDPHAYARPLSRLAAAGRVVAVPKMPGNFAFFDTGAGARLRAANPAVRNWVIAGHSLGGAMAAAAVKAEVSAWRGLALLDSYPADSDSLAGWNGGVLVLFSAQAKADDQARLQKTLGLLPPATWIGPASRAYPAAGSGFTVLHVIPGGSHSFFGDYGPQDGDLPPTTTRAAFQDELVDYLGEFIDRTGGAP